MASNHRAYKILELSYDEDVEAIVYTHTNFEDLHVVELYVELHVNNPARKYEFDLNVGFEYCSDYGAASSYVGNTLNYLTQNVVTNIQPLVVGFQHNFGLPDVQGERLKEVDEFSD
ncbi:hypothetical protein J1N35_018571 [Gossypium stocksii]|uniref:Uncharacterized protein n=1 Tax=Gossypium stocksii TaxID=47602 RepID=A0A9D4A6A8_9ROSI|nr:hypothetical protein J1N35_018571 [Gossypium stocksii]